MVVTTNLGLRSQGPPLHGTLSQAIHAGHPVVGAYQRGTGVVQCTSNEAAGYVLILLLRLLGVKDEASLELVTDLPRAMERAVVLRSNLSPAMKQQVLVKSEAGLGYLILAQLITMDAKTIQITDKGKFVFGLILLDTVTEDRKWPLKEFAKQLSKRVIKILKRPDQALKKGRVVADLASRSGGVTTTGGPARSSSEMAVQANGEDAMDVDDPVPSEELVGPATDEYLTPPSTPAPRLQTATSSYGLLTPVGGDQVGSAADVSFLSSEGQQSRQSGILANFYLPTPTNVARYLTPFKWRSKPVIPADETLDPRSNEQLDSTESAMSQDDRETYQRELARRELRIVRLKARIQHRREAIAHLNQKVSEISAGSAKVERELREQLEEFERKTEKLSQDNDELLKKLREYEEWFAQAFKTFPGGKQAKFPLLF